MKTNKDLVFWSFVIIWISTDLISYLIIKDTFLISVLINPIFIIIAWVTVLIKNNNHKFNLWLGKKLKR